MRRLIATATAVLALAAVATASAEECTAAVVSAAGSADGAPLLWKNRDTDTLSNKLVWVDEQPFDYLCLANANSASGRMCYAGLNAAGFAIINTVAYNLPEGDGEMADLEGAIMADALRSCRTVADFEAYLNANLGPDLGSLANFGVLDADGGAALYEVHNHGFVRLDAAAAPDGRLVVTNFARTGTENEGAGYLRFERASELFASLAPQRPGARAILQRFSRDLGHTLLDHPELAELAAQPASPPRWISSRDCIDRPDTAASVVIVGRQAAAPATLWVIPGEPLTAIAVPVWVEAGASPAALWRGSEAELWRESLRVKRLLRPASEGHKGDYLDLTRLDNADGTGWLPTLLGTEREILDRTAGFLTEPRSSAELAAFQEEMASLALATLRGIR
jgi:hypothetical protein